MLRNVHVIGIKTVHSFMEIKWIVLTEAVVSTEKNETEIKEL